MKNSDKLLFEKQYEDGLRIHLKRRSKKSSTPRAARTLGIQALSLNFKAVDVVRAHEMALAALDTVSHSLTTLKADISLSPAGNFLVSALGPIEHAHETALAKNRKSLREVENRLKRESACNAKLVSEFQSSIQQSQQLAHQFLHALEEERKEISRELHDQVAQILAGINVRLAALKKASMLDHEILEERIAQTQLLVEESVEAVHNYARKLRPVMLDDLGLIPSIRSFIKDLPGGNGLRIRFKHDLEPRGLSNTKRTVLYRVAQEAITNVIRHAKATTLLIRLDIREEGVRLEVSDNGKSFNLKRILSSNLSKRLGLLGMRERVEMVGGVFDIQSPSGKGTEVRAEIPYDDKIKSEGNHP